MKKRNLIIFITGIVVLVLGAGMLGKNNIKAENKVAFKDKTTQEKILYRVTKETKKDKGDIYDEASEIIADETGDNKKDVQKELEDHQKKMDKLAQKARKANIKVSSKEVDDVIEKTKKALHEDEEGREQLNAVLEGSAMTESEYWKSMRQFYEKNLLIEKYLAQQENK